MYEFGLCCVSGCHGPWQGSCIFSECTLSGQGLHTSHPWQSWGPAHARFCQGSDQPILTTASEWQQVMLPNVPQHRGESQDQPLGSGVTFAAVGSTWNAFDSMLHPREILFFTFAMPCIVPINKDTWQKMPLAWQVPWTQVSESSFLCSVFNVRVAFSI